jgi:glycerol-3-phosphate acyltransferase PlsY
MLTINWEIGVIAAALWILTAAIFRISSLAALVAVALTPLSMLALGQPAAFLIAALFMGVLIFIRHDANIRRLLRGEEPRIGAKSHPITAPHQAP